MMMALMLSWDLEKGRKSLGRDSYTAEEGCLYCRYGALMTRAIMMRLSIIPFPYLGHRTTHCNVSYLAKNASARR